jgi:hypothetical protein
LGIGKYSGGTVSCMRQENIRIFADHSGTASERIRFSR